MLGRSTGVVVALTAAVSVLMPGPTGAASPASRDEAAAKGLISARARHVFISPNGDGRQDAAVVRYRLSKPSAVRARVVSSGGRTVRTYQLRDLASGPHRLRWDGRNSRHAVVRNGSYRIVVHATHGQRAAVAKVRVTVDNIAPSYTGAIPSNRTTVYPRTTLFTDQVRFLVSTAPRRGAEDLESVTATIRRPDRTVVDTLVRRGVGTVKVTWDGRDRQGGVVDPGKYTLHLAFTDRAGNQAVRRIEVVVSDKPLVEHSETITRPAAEWSGFSPPTGAVCGPEDPNGCTDPTTCMPVPSDRFPGGSSFRGGCGGSRLEHGSVAVYYLRAETGHERFRVTAVGGPTTPGSADAAELNGISMQGDGSFTTPWTPIQPVVDDVLARGQWQVSTSPLSSYDVATYSVERTFYSPAS